MNRFVLFALTAIVVAGTQVTSGSGTSSKPAVFSTSAGAIRGYDTVAYFTEGRAVKGDRTYTYSWNGAHWYFSIQENRDLFRENPERYAPQYGGYCAYAMSKGSYASTSPKAWTIYEGKLYLNYSRAVRKTWSKDKPLFIGRANRNWQQFRAVA